jgi:hypothetical protein
MEFIPFEKLNNELNLRLKNTKLYTDESFSFLKVVQHGLSYALLDSKNKLLKTYFFLPFGIQKLLYAIKGLIKPSLPPHCDQKSFVIFDEGRQFEMPSGEVVSMYFDKLIKYVGKQNCVHVGLGGDKRINFDLKFNLVSDVSSPLDATESRMLRSICATLSKIKRSGEFSKSEIQYIDSAFHVFFTSFRKNYRFLKGSRAKHALFCVHYHKEGLIAALKVLGIESIEVQHGLISRNDFYYVYHEQFRAVAPLAFFPDKIVLYGTYWKDVLSSGAEWKKDQLIVAGNYLANAREKKVDSIKKENIIFIGAQKNLAKQYTGYCIHLQNILTSKGHNWRVVVKMHPLEKTPDVYRNNLPKHGIEVLGNESNLFDVLAKSRIQISIYSTTFFDALGYDVLNFSLQNFTNSADYAREMVEEGVALPLEYDEDPVQRFEELQKTEHYLLTHEQVYGVFPESEFLSSLVI